MNVADGFFLLSGKDPEEEGNKTSQEMDINA